MIMPGPLSGLARSGRLVLALTLVLLGFVSACSNSSPELKQSDPATIAAVLDQAMRSAAPEIDLAEGRLRAYMFVTLSDCRDNIARLIAGFGQPSDTAHVPLVGFFFQGDPDSLPEARRELNLAGVRQVAVLSTPGVIEAVNRFGEPRRPFIVMIDRRNEIRFVGPNAMTYDALYAWRRLLPLLREFSDGQAEYIQ